MIQGGGESNPQATAITLSAEERRALEALSRSTKSEARMPLRSRIVLLAAEGAATREISRRLGCTIGTVSKWRVRYANDRMTDLSEVGKRGAEPKYGLKHQQRLLARLNRPPPAGDANWTNWTAPLPARAWRHPRAVYLALSARSDDRPVGAEVLVPE